MTPQQHTDLHPWLGPGLFDDERVPGSIDRAMAAIAEFIADFPDNEKKLTKPFDEIIARAALREPIRNYWADNDHDHRIRFSEMKSQARRFKVTVKQFDKSVQSLSAPMKAAMRMSLARQYGTAFTGEDHLTTVHELTSALVRACKTLIEPDYGKVADRGVVSLAEPLWDYWESIRTKTFKRSWVGCDTRSSLVERLGPISFSATDALFVQVVIKAIDSQAAFSDIRTRLKGVAKKRPAAGKSRRAVAR